MIVLTIPLVIMGVSSLYTLGKRTWALTRTNSTCRPLGQTSRLGLDFFNWNFMFGFVALVVLISVGIALKSVVVVSLPASILLLYICLELLLVEAVFMPLNRKTPIRFSSVPRGQPVVPGVSIIVEDICAVDGGQGQEFRQAWRDRYEASPVLRQHLKRMDWLWGSTGLAVVAVVWATVFGLKNHDVGFVVGEYSQRFPKERVRGC